MRDMGGVSHSGGFFFFISSDKRNRRQENSSVHIVYLVDSFYQHVLNGREDEEMMRDQYLTCGRVKRKRIFTRIKGGEKE